MNESHNLPIVEALLTMANGTAERAAVFDMIEDDARPAGTVGDQTYDTANFVAGER